MIVQELFNSPGRNIRLLSTGKLHSMLIIPVFQNGILQVINKIEPAALNSIYITILRMTDEENSRNIAFTDLRI